MPCDRLGLLKSSTVGASKCPSLILTLNLQGPIFSLPFSCLSLNLPMATL